MPYAALIPMPAIAAILFMVAYNMCGFKEFAYLVKTSPKSDISVLLVTFVLTVVFDLVVAIEVGIIVAAVLFMKRMSDVTQVEGWKYIPFRIIRWSMKSVDRCFLQRQTSFLVFMFPRIRSA